MAAIFLIMPHKAIDDKSTFAIDEYYAPEAVCRTREEAEVLVTYYNATRADEMEYEDIVSALAYSDRLPTERFLEVAGLGVRRPGRRVEPNDSYDWWCRWINKFEKLLQKGDPITKEMLAAIGAQIPLYSIIEKNIEKPTDVIPKRWLE